MMTSLMELYLGGNWENKSLSASSLFSSSIFSGLTYSFTSREVMRADNKYILEKKPTLPQERLRVI